MPGTTASTPKKHAPAKEAAAPTGRTAKEKATAGAKETAVPSAGTGKGHAADKGHIAEKAHAPAKGRATTADKSHTSEKSQVAAKPEAADKPQRGSDKAHGAGKAQAEAKATASEDAHTATGKHVAAPDKAHAPADKATTKAAPRHDAPHRKPGDGYAADQKFLESQRKALAAERSTYVEQAQSLRAEADSLVEEMEPGDIQFDEESGEGGTVTVDRERDLALSAQALVAVEEIDHALAKIELGTYGICEGCGTVIPKNRLEALPYARLCIACKSGGLSRR